MHQIWILLKILCLTLFSLVLTEESIDTREGEDIFLKCRFKEQQRASEFSYYWARWTTQPVKFENVAIGDIQLNSNYRLVFKPDKGIYDLQIKNVSYNRDNGRFECRIKERGTGLDVHEEHYNVTVLSVPQPPVINLESVITEDQKTNLTCSSFGGSPDPVINWFRDGVAVPLQMSAFISGGSKDIPTTSTLSIVPRKEDDAALYKCIVWNRAMPEGQKLEATVTLNVNYYPRVEVGPANPMRVENDRSAKLECNVDSKPKVSNVRWSRESFESSLESRYIASSFIYSIQRVTEQDIGKYKCTADNGLGRVGESEIYLDVLYSPNVVIESKTKEVQEGASLSVRCNATSNPRPVTIEWLKEGNPEFRYNGQTLKLGSVKSENAGNYVCRAVNIMEPFDGKSVEREGNSTFALLVRHRPGQAFITPNKPIVAVGNGVTLSCAANPPGWPVPQYRWFRDLDSDHTVSNSKILAQGSQYVIPRVHLGSEGKYHCSAINELGAGEIATISLEVHQSPLFLAKLQQHITRRTGDKDFAVTCSAKGKPKPNVRWLKDGSEILPEVNLYEIKTNPTQSSNGMVTVQSMLKFYGKSRPNYNQLIPGDRGRYTCVYENEVNQSNSTMQLKIEHEPIILNQYNKVATDIRESAEVICKVQSYPKPEFQWFYGNNPSPLSMSSDGHYEINTISDNNDIFTSILRIHQLVHNDYGDYTCRISNSLNSIRTVIRLQQKGKPEKPTNVQSKEIGSNYVTLTWDPGFDGGLSNTLKYFVTYRRVSHPHKDSVITDCSTIISTNTDWMEYDCQREIPCTIRSLDQYQSYIFKIKARNAKGESDFSNEILTTTKVNKIPSPLHVTYDLNSKILGINIGATCLSLIAVVETLINENTASAAWEIVDTIPLQVSGNGPTFKETVIRNFAATRRPNSARSLGSTISEDNVPITLENDDWFTLRVKLCLNSNQEHCGEYSKAEIGSSYIVEASALPVPTLIGIVVSCVVFALFVSLVLMFCRCKRNQIKKNVSTKEFEMDSVRPSLANQQNQAPPPYYPASGLDNKALEHSMDLALTMEDQKTPVYGSQIGFSYHHSSNGIQVPPNSMRSNDWVNMNYIENSYSNSNNGGSVNSQDSLWQVKMSNVGNQANLVPSLNYVERQPSYGYDPMAHGGYGTVDDYASYPQLTTTSSQHGDEYHNLRNSQNLSSQDYCSDPYASVQKPKKRIDQNLDSPFHDVSGLPDPFMEQSEQDNSKSIQQHMPLNYEENVESGYSTPNSRNRRVIREIIV